MSLSLCGQYRAHVYEIRKFIFVKYIWDVYKRQALMLMETSFKIVEYKCFTASKRALLNNARPKYSISLYFH